MLREGWQGLELSAQSHHSAITVLWSIVRESWGPDSFHVAVTTKPERIDLGKIDLLCPWFPGVSTHQDTWSDSLVDGTRSMFGDTRVQGGSQQQMHPPKALAMTCFRQGGSAGSQKTAPPARGQTFTSGISDPNHDRGLNTYTRNETL